jgi:hypothetical protein
MDKIIIPDKITIEFLDNNGDLINQDNILIGIQTHANRKNDIKLAPFLTDKNGLIMITKQDLFDKADVFISYGLMDYSSLDSAKQNIEIYFYGVSDIIKHLDYWDNILAKSKYLKQYEHFGDKLGKHDIEMAMIEKRERIEYDLYKDSYNLKTKILSNILIVSDVWNGSDMDKNYKVKFDRLKNN